MPKSIRRFEDPLWKAILEHVFADFPRFYFFDVEIASIAEVPVSLVQDVRKNLDQ